MQTITNNTGNVSVYTFADDATLTSSTDNITTPSFIIGDMNSGNSTIHTGVTAPDGWQGGKHTFDGTSWGNVAGWADPKVAQIAALQAQIDALNAQEKFMPTVKGKKYPYTAAGKKAATAASKPKKSPKKKGY